MWRYNNNSNNSYYLLLLLLLVVVLLFRVQSLYAVIISTRGRKCSFFQVLQLPVSVHAAFHMKLFFLLIYFINYSRFLNWNDMGSMLLLPVDNAALDPRFFIMWFFPSTGILHHFSSLLSLHACDICTSPLPHHILIPPFVCVLLCGREAEWRGWSCR